MDRKLKCLIVISFMIATFLGIITGGFMVIAALDHNPQNIYTNNYFYLIPIFYVWFASISTPLYSSGIINLIKKNNKFFHFHIFIFLVGLIFTISLSIFFYVNLSLFYFINIVLIPLNIIFITFIFYRAVAYFINRKDISDDRNANTKKLIRGESIR